MPGVVATLGFFDGVHVGHRHLISQVKAEAGRLGLPSAVITFPVHPRKVLQADYQPKLLCGYEEKLEQLATTEVDYCISLPFTTELSRLTAREFITDVFLWVTTTGLDITGKRALMPTSLTATQWE